MLGDVLVHVSSGALYGAVSVLSAQPFDTLKTHLQSNSGSSAVSIARRLHSEGGLQALYRGGLPVLLGGALFRAAQFGCFEAALSAMGGRQPAADRWRITQRITVDPRVVAAGLLGGVGRGLVETPFELNKA